MLCWLHNLLPVQRMWCAVCMFVLPSCYDCCRAVMARAAQQQSYDPTEGLTFESEEKIKVVSSFEGLNLKDALLRGVYQFGFEKPSAIQQRAILPIVQGRDVIAQAQSGTGKTSMIAISLVQLLDPSLNECAASILRQDGCTSCTSFQRGQCGTQRVYSYARQRWSQPSCLFSLRRVQSLILSPTRELAAQTTKTIQAVGEFLRVKAHTCVGGTSLGAPWLSGSCPLLQPAMDPGSPGRGVTSYVLPCSWSCKARGVGQAVCMHATWRQDPFDGMQACGKAFLHTATTASSSDHRLLRMTCVMRECARAHTATRQKR